MLYGLCKEKYIKNARALWYIVEEIGFIICMWIDVDFFVITQLKRLIIIFTARSKYTYQKKYEKH